MRAWAYPLSKTPFHTLPGDGTNAGVDAHGDEGLGNGLAALAILGTLRDVVLELVKIGTLALSSLLRIAPWLAVGVKAFRALLRGPAQV